MTSLYRSVFEKALKLIFERKYLILFGLFASTIFGDREFDFLFQGYSISSSHPYIFSSFSEMVASGFFVNLWNNLLTLLGYYTLETTGIMLILLGFSIIVLILAILAQIGLVIGSISKKKEKMRIVIQKSVSYFWQVLIVHILMKLTTVFVIGIILAPLAMTLISASSLETLLFFIFFIILIPLLVVLTTTNKYAVIAVISKNLDAIDAIKYALRLILRDWFVSIEALILLMVVRIFGYFFTILASLVLTLPFLILFFASMYFQWYMIISISFFISLIVAFISFFTFGGGLNAFHHISWILIFEEISHGRALPKLERLFGNNQKPKKNSVQKSIKKTLDAKSVLKKRKTTNSRKRTTTRKTAAPKTSSSKSQTTKKK